MFWSLENPFSSGLFEFPPIAAEVSPLPPAPGGEPVPAPAPGGQSLQVIQVRYERCAWGASFKKPSEFRTNFAPLQALGKRCKEPPT